jgi:hypothetical protein
MTYDMPRNWVKYVCLSTADCEGNLGQLIAYFVSRAGFPAFISASLGPQLLNFLIHESV